MILRTCLPYGLLLWTLVGFSACESDTVRRRDYAIQGIDISHHQAAVDWSALPEQDIRFVWIKATEGTDLADSLFEQNWCAAMDVGIIRGAYHFFRPGSPVLDQVLNYLGHVDLGPGDLPPVLDVEVTDGLNREELILRIRAWLTLVEARTGIRPILYANQRFYNDYLADAFPDHPVWIARYSRDHPELVSLRPWHFWQYGDRGKLKGIRGYVDFNVFSGKPDELEDLRIKAPAGETTP